MADNTEDSEESDPYGGRGACLVFLLLITGMVLLTVGFIVNTHILM